MADFINYSAFPALKYEGIDHHDIRFHIVAAHVTYDADINKKTGDLKLTLSPEQSALNYTDLHYHDPLRSSVKYESDLAPYKPETDIIINATAYAPKGNATRFFDVAVKIGGNTKTLNISGPRWWKSSPLGWLLGKPESIDQLDIIYEYASGGWHQTKDKTFVSPNNPLGTGWYPNEYLKHCKDRLLPAPQITLPDSPVYSPDDLVTPAGFGFFGKSWHGRIGYAGTYDSVWLEERHPYLPADFDFRYWNGAHPSLKIPHPKPCRNIPVELTGLLPANEVTNQHVAFSIPVETLFIFVKTASNIGITKDMLLDTIVIDMKVRKIFCTYRVILAEALEPTEIQLRYIAPANRQQQKKMAAELLQDSTASLFLPLPPGLLNNKLSEDKDKHG